MISSRLREARVQLGHTQESLAETLGMDVRQIWRYENGQTEAKESTLVKIAQALNVSVDWLLGLSDDPTPDELKSTLLSPQEKAVIANWRKGAKIEAIKVIIGDE